MSLPVRVIGDRVLVALPPKPHEQEAATGYTYQAGETTASGLILAKPADVYNVEVATRGIVLQLGEKSGTVDIDEVLAILHEYCMGSDDLDVRAAIRALAPAPFDVQVGDCVIFPAGAGEQFEQDGIEYVVLREAEILGVVEPTQQEAA